MVEAAELSRASAAEAAGGTEDAESEPDADQADLPDPAEIWGEEGSNGSKPRASDRDRRKSPTRRRLERSRPGRAYSNWKYRRSELE